MRKKKVTATFIGESRLDYKFGNDYILEINHLPDRNISYVVLSPEGTYDIIGEYSTMITFLDNWTDIKVINS